MEEFITGISFLARPETTCRMLPLAFPVWASKGHQTSPSPRDSCGEPDLSWNGLAEWRPLNDKKPSAPIRGNLDGYTAPDHRLVSGAGWQRSPSSRRWRARLSPDRRGHRSGTA